MPPRKAVKPAERNRDSILWSIDAYLDKTADAEAMPDIIEWTLSDRFLGRNLYPAQGTMLKIWSLQDELFTQFDYDLIGKWTDDFSRTQDNGTQVDILERIRINKAEGRPWFREWINILGRRGAKGYVGAIAGSYVLWHYINKGDPHAYFGLDRDKPLAMLVFAGKKDQAITNQWGDLNNVITGAPCFVPYLPQKTLMKESLYVYAPHDFIRIQDREEMGVHVNVDTMCSFQILPKESTLLSARGPAVFAEMFDEMAHITRETAKVSAEELWVQATPALDTFKKEAFIYEGSSPWQMIGQFYENAQQAVAISDGLDGFEVGAIVRPEIFLLQLESWRPYEGWDKAHETPLRPPGKERPHATFYPKQRQAVQEYDDQMRRLEAANPETFSVERRSRWAAVLDAYLNPGRVDAMFAPWPEALPVNLKQASEGKMLTTYYAHSDPSKVGKNTSLVVCHKVDVVGDPMPHVIVDYVTHWEPSQFIHNNYEIDYREIRGEMAEVIRQFMPTEFTFDQGYSAEMIQELRRYVNGARLPKPVNVFQRTTTFQSNWEVAETFKYALGLGLVHCYDGTRSTELLKNECKFLQLVADRKVDHPTAGPVQTSDIYDALSILVHVLIGRHIAALVGQDMMSLGVVGSHPGGFSQPGIFGEQQKPPVQEVAARLMAVHQPRYQQLPAARGGRFQTRPGRLPRR